MPAVPRYTKEIGDKIKTIIDRLIANDEYPSIAGIAVEIGIPHSTLKEWANANSEFKHDDVVCEIARARDYREQWLERHGADGSANPQIVRFLLSNHAGYAEKSVQDVTVGADPNRPFKVSLEIGDI